MASVALARSYTPQVFGITYEQTVRSFNLVPCLSPFMDFVFKSNSPDDWFQTEEQELTKVIENLKKYLEVAQLTL